MSLTKVKKTFQIDSGDRDVIKYPTNGDYVINLPRNYKNVTSLRLKGAEINSSFIPTSIPGCQLWLDASDSTSVVLSGSNVTQWNDKSGNGNNATQTTANSRPTYSQNGIYFSKTADALAPQFLNISNRNLVRNVPYAGMFIVSRIGSQQTQNGLQRGTAFSATVGTTALGRFVITLASNSTNLNPGVLGRREDTEPSISALDSTTPLALNTTNMFMGEISYQGRTLTNFINGSQINTLTNPNFTSGNTSDTQSFSATPITINSPQTTNRMNDAFVYEMILYTSPLTTAQRQQIEAYLAYKWGFQSSLPATHPYFNSNRIPQNIAIRNYNTSSSLTSDLLVASPTLYYFLLEIEGLNKSDETRVSGEKSTFTDKYFAKIPMTANSAGLITYNDKNLQENVAEYTPAIENLDRLKIKLRTHGQQDGSGFIYFRNDYNLTFEIEYLENSFDTVKIWKN